MIEEIDSISSPSLEFSSVVTNDIAAGLIIIKEAGGVINDINLNNHNNLNVIASSPDINDKFIKKISNF